MKTLHELAVEKFGSEAGVAHEVALLNRRLAYRASHVPARKVPPATVAALGTEAYVAEFERINCLRSVK